MMSERKIIPVDDPDTLRKQVRRSCSKEEFESATRIVCDPPPPPPLDESDPIEKHEAPEPTGGWTSEDSEIYNQMVGFMYNSEEERLEFPTTLSSRQRKLVHSLAESFRMTHESSGKGKRRFITVEKRDGIDRDDHTITEVFFYKGYVGLTGLCVNHAARSSMDRVPSSYLRNRHYRDGSDFHITVLSRKETFGLIDEIIRTSSPAISEQQAVARMMEGFATLPDDWVDLGLGKITNTKEISSPSPSSSSSSDIDVDVNTIADETYFKVIEWKAGDKFRKELGLPEHTFHITLGYKRSDIHGIRKDISTLLASLSVS